MGLLHFSERMFSLKVETLEKLMDVNHLIFVKGVGFPVDEVLDGVNLVHNCKDRFVIDELDSFSVGLQ